MRWPNTKKNNTYPGAKKKLTPLPTYVTYVYFSLYQLIAVPYKCVTWYEQATAWCTWLTYPTLLYIIATGSDAIDPFTRYSTSNQLNFVNAIAWIILTLQRRDMTIKGVSDYRQLNTLRPRQNGHRFADDTFKRIFLSENVRISIEISLNFVPKSPNDNIPTLFQIMAWRRPGDKLLSEAMMVSLLTHICVARPQWVNWFWTDVLQTCENFQDAPI